MSIQKNRAILFINLGTPAKLTYSSIRKYLQEFLFDGRVIDLPFLFRFFLVNGIIIPFRTKKTYHKYQQIWDWKTNQSPLVIYTRSFIEKIKKRIPHLQIDYAMRYGSPSIEDKLTELYHSGIRNVHVIPLYPQYATSTFGTVIAKIYSICSRFWDPLMISLEPPFFDDVELQKIWARKIKREISNYKDYWILFSFHGVPIRHIQKSDVLGLCLKNQCCEKLPSYCYRAQTIFMAKQIARMLNIHQWKVAYQSRFGKEKWLQPYLEEEIITIASRYKKIAIVPLSFVTDCLETLEELALSLPKMIKHKTKYNDVEIKVISSLNDDEDWISFWEKRIRKL